MSKRFLRIAALLLLGAAPAAAQSPQPAGPEPGAALSVYLVTIGQGDLVWEKFGHNGIWIRDPVRGTDRVYHWGLFDFNSPGYWGRFLRGNWIYQIGVDDIQQTLAAYRYFDRSVLVQELNLTPAQKAELRDFVEWNARPENREYHYDYYRDNCSTRVRDVIDLALGGQLRAATDDEPTGTTYRWHSRRLIADDELAYTGLAAGLGPAADRPISQWEEMFLPGKVAERVREMRVTGADGQPVPLVLSEQVLYEAAGRPAERRTPPFWVPYYLLIGVVLGGVMAALGARARRSRAARFGFAALASLWSLIVGTGGVILVALWTVTDHSIAYRNENLFQFDPLALGLVLLAPALAYGARWAARPARWLALAVAGIGVLGLFAQLIPGLDQVNGAVIALLLPAHLGLAWAVNRLALAPPAPDASPPSAPSGRAAGGRSLPASR